MINTLIISTPFPNKLWSKSLICTALMLLLGSFGSFSQNGELLLQQADLLKRKAERSKSYQLIERVLSESQAQSNNLLHAKALSTQVAWFSYFSQYDSALVLAKKMVDFAEEKKLTDLLPELYFQNGKVALRVFNYDLTLALLEKAKELATLAGRTDILLGSEAYIRDALEIYYYGSTRKFNPQNVMEPISAAIDQFKVSKDTANYLSLLVRYTEIYRNFGTVDSIQLLIGEYEEILRTYPNASAKITLHSQKASLAGVEERQTERKKQLREALSLSKKYRYPKGEQHYYIRLHHYFMEVEDYDNAVSVLDSAIAAAPIKNIAFGGHDLYYEAYVGAKNYPKAIEHIEAWKKAYIKESRQEKLGSITEWETKYNTQQKEIQLKEQASIRNWLLIVLGLILLFSIFLIRTNTAKQKANRALLEKNETIEKQAEELRNLDTIKSHFFANVSHELRTPLTLMIAPIESILKRSQLSNRDYTQLLMAKRSGKQLQKMVNEILDLTKLESGKLELSPSSVVFYNFLRVLVANFESLSNSKHINFSFKYEANKKLQVEIDKEKVETILVNLLSNAFKFTQKDGKVGLVAKEDGQHLLMQVSDTGRGIHPDDLPYVFDRFYQTKQKEAVAEGGTGIGLALSREFVQLMSGNLHVESELDRGSTFFVKIPKVEVIGQLSNEEALLIENEKVKIENSELEENFREKEILNLDSKEIAFDSKKPIILLVEDNQDLSFFIKSLLETKYNVLTAENGKEALERLTVEDGQWTEGAKNRPPSIINRQPSLIITDLMMPIMDGFQLIRELKSQDDYRHLPIIVLSARAELKDKIDTLRIGVDDYMLKPFVEEELFARVENLLKNRKERQSSVQNPPATSNQQLTPDNQHLTTEQDLEWLKNLEEKLKAKLGHSNFKVDDLLPDFGMNRTYFYQKIKQLTGLTPNQHLQEMRLNQARYLLETQTQKSVKAIAYEVGFKDPVYFARLFKKRFGKLPSAYR